MDARPYHKLSLVAYGLRCKKLTYQSAVFRNDVAQERAMVSRGGAMVNQYGLFDYMS
jgi:hypothetical protein